ncbi:hypothetical protein ACFQMM_00035 [Saliphagus sp. GCM10025308]
MAALESTVAVAPVAVNPSTSVASAASDLDETAAGPLSGASSPKPTAFAPEVSSDGDGDADAELAANAPAPTLAGTLPRTSTIRRAATNRRVTRLLLSRASKTVLAS